MTGAPLLEPRNVCLVTVTYGQRFPLLKRVLAGAFANGVGRALVVDNGCPEPVEELMATLSADWVPEVKVLRLPENRGSAGGFHQGLAVARDEPAFPFVWLLDDDNLPAAGSLASLLAAYETLAVEKGPGNLALLSLREDRLYLKRLLDTGLVSRSFPRKSSFLGFHVSDGMGKLARHFLRVDPLSKRGEAASSSILAIPYGPYGGLFFNTEVLARHGLPRREMYLYSDDTEFTCRFTSGGGSLFLVSDSKVQDIDQTWMSKAEGGNTFSRLLNAESADRVYFGIRNQIMFELEYWTGNRVVYDLNRGVFLTILRAMAQAQNKTRRCRLIERAITDGLRGLESLG